MHPCELCRVNFRDGRRPAKPSLALRGLAAEDVLLERMSSQKFPVLRPLEALGRAAVGLQLDLFHF